MSVSRAVVLGLFALPVPAAAQGFSASRYLAPPSGEDLAVTERALVTPHLRVGAVVVGEYTHALTAAGGGVIDHRVTAHVGATLGLFDRLQLGVVMPVVITQQGASIPDAFSAGDLRVDARLRVAGLARGARVRLALATSLSAPLGAPSAYTGDGAVGVTPRILFEATNGRDFVFALNAGVALRPGWVHQAFARAAVTIPLVPRVVVTVEGSFEARLRDTGADGALALELLGGVRHVSRRGLALGVAAGPRVLSGDATADVRAVATVGYAPQPPLPDESAGDRDADGVIDPDDRCPDDPAGARPDPDARGCPLHLRVGAPSAAARPRRARVPPARPRPRRLPRRRRRVPDAASRRRPRPATTRVPQRRPRRRRRARRRRPLPP